MEWIYIEDTKRFVAVEPTVGRTDYQSEIAVLNGNNIPYIAYCDMVNLKLPGRSAPHRPKVSIIWIDSLSTYKAERLLSQNHIRAVSKGAFFRRRYVYFRAYDLGPFFFIMRRKLVNKFKSYFKRAKPFYSLMENFVLFRLWRPGHLRTVLRHCLRINRSHSKDQEHIDAALGWIERSILVTKGQGSAMRYYFNQKGWGSAYPETSGYLICTLLRVKGGRKWFRYAQSLADWLITIQNANGSFDGGDVDEDVGPSVFNSGQILQGLIATYQATADVKYLNAAVKAGDWLVSLQEENGVWRRYECGSIPHAYHTRVSWPLLQLWRVCHNDTYKKSAINNLDWCLSRAQENGWVQQCGYSVENHRAPFTHFIAYAMEGFWEAGLILNRSDWLDQALRTARAFKSIFEIKGTILGEYRNDWTTDVKYQCVTGLAQIALVWKKIGLLEGGDWRISADKLLRQVKSYQDLTIRNDGIRGGLPGSWPLWGSYSAWSYPNWAVKFFLDAMIA